VEALRILLAPKIEAAAGNVPPLIQLPLPSQSDRQVKSLFRVWILIYAVVGAQMGWFCDHYQRSPSCIHVVLWKGGNFFLGCACAGKRFLVTL